MNNYRSNWQATAGLSMLMMVVISSMVFALPGTSKAADPGINQPGAAGNRRGIGR